MSHTGILIAVAVLPPSNFFQFCYDCGCYSYYFSLTLQIFKHFRMLGPHRKFEVHTSFSCRDRANDAHKFSTNLRHYFFLFHHCRLGAHQAPTPDPPEGGRLPPSYARLQTRKQHKASFMSRRFKRLLRPQVTFTLFRILKK